MDGYVNYVNHINKSHTTNSFYNNTRTKIKYLNNILVGEQTVDTWYQIASDVGSIIRVTGVKNHTNGTKYDVYDSGGRFFWEGNGNLFYLVQSDDWYLLDVWIEYI